MESNDSTSPTGASNIKLLIGAGLVIVALGAFFILRGDTPSENMAGVQSDPKLEELIALGTSMSDRLRRLSEDQVGSFLDDGARIVVLYESLKKEQIREAKRLDMEDPDAVKSFLENYDTLKKVEPGTDDCGSFALLTRSSVSRKGISDGNVEKLQNLALESCERINALDVVDVSRDTETIPTSDEIVEEESSTIPAGQSFLAAKAQNGTREIVMISVEGESQGSFEVVTKEPVVGKRIVGTGDNTSIADSVRPKLDALLDSWNKGLQESDIADYLEEPHKDTADILKDRYDQTIFNWLRFEGLELDTSRATFRVDNNPAAPFIMTVPATVSNMAENRTSEIQFSYDPASDAWVAGWITFNSLFKTIVNQKILAAYSPDTVVYDAADTCEDNWNFDRTKGVSILEMGVSDEHKFFMQTKNGAPDQLVVSIPGTDAQVEIITDGYGTTAENIPPEFVERINSDRATSWVITEFNYQRHSQKGDECRATPNIAVSFFAE